mgnify:CR=1 FL=1
MKPREFLPETLDMELRIALRDVLESTALPVLVQTLVYIILGTVWLLPLRRFLIWMETGRWG